MVEPLQRFLDGEMKNITRERKVLENKRLDLDACKNKVRKARSIQGQQQKEGVDPRAILDQAENELRLSQSEFDRQVEITKLLMEGLSQSQTNHLRHLHALVESQV
jgi:endophilin-B